MSIFDQTSGISYSTLSLAISGSSSNDTLLVPAGSYVENFPDITHNLTIDSVGGLASLSTLGPVDSTYRAILNVPFDAGVNLSISGLELSGANRPGANPNGAGILFEIGNGNLTVTNSWIHGNQEGVLTGGPDAASPGGVMNVTISHSEIDNNGAPAGSTYATNGLDHNIYAGALTSLTVTDSYIHSVYSQGSEIKSRALTTTITNNRIDDAPTLTNGVLGASYDIDIPNGGSTIITGNVIEKGVTAVNRYMVHIGGENPQYPNTSLLLSGNTFINDRAAGATGIYNATTDPNFPGLNVPIPATITDNTLYNVDCGAPNQDAFEPLCGDTVNGNTFISGTAPALDTSPGFSFAVVEPATAGVLLFALLGLAAARRSWNVKAMRA